VNGPPQLIATDLDGTLLRSDLTLSERTVATLRAASAEGILVALVTGRPIRWLKRVYDQLGMAVPAVCANGAVVYDPELDKVLHVSPMLPAVLADLCQRVRTVVPDARFAVEVEDGRVLHCVADYPLRWDRYDPAIRVVGSLTELTSVAAVKLLVRGGERDPDEFTSLVAGCLDGLAEATHSSLSGLVEVSAAGVTKAAGLAWLCAQHEVPASAVVAFGDMPNDLPLLAWAGRAVAVANAHPAVLAAADEVTAANDSDGVAAYLERLFAAAQPSS
jgi:hydroxymethylpyrimidine pyrophosphatase-like HAD family hydrolase